jgi:hypothetical protein
MFRINATPPSVFIADREARLVRYHDTLEVEVECPLSFLQGTYTQDFPPRLQINLLVGGVHGAPAAVHRYLLSSTADEQAIGLSLFCGEDRGVWREHVSIAAIYEAMLALPDFERYSLALDIEFDSENSSLFISACIPKEPGADLLGFVADTIILSHQLIDRAESRFFKFFWNSAYQTDEPLFTKELVIPLLRKLGFDSVRYHHGIHEYGRDVLFAERDRFNQIRHLAAQIKAGDISLSNRKELDTLISQIDDSFAMPVEGPGQSKQFHIAALYVIVSGKFSESAIRVLTQKTNPRIVGSLYFLDKSDIEHLAQSLWPL